MHSQEWITMRHAKKSKNGKREDEEWQKESSSCKKAVRKGRRGNKIERSGQWKGKKGKL